MFAAKNTAAPSGEAVYIESVFSTYLYTGNGSTQTITNGIDLSGKGGLVWLKKRSSATGGSHRLMDTVRGGNKLLSSNTTGAESTSNQVTFLSSGFDVIDAVDNGATYVSWTFREQAKFFDVVTYTGNGTQGRSVSHNLGSAPGWMVVKRTDGVDNWRVYHRSLGGTKFMSLDTTAAAGTANTLWNDADPTSTVFYLGNDASVNGNGMSYVAYLFAHDAGGFGATGSDNVISCGSYTGNGSATGPTVTLGYEPQFLILKAASGGTSGSQDWNMVDNMRGWTVSSNAQLNPNLSAAETQQNNVALTSTGFRVTTAGADFNGNGNTYIYIAIRRGPMKTPTSGTSVFSPKATQGPSSGSTTSSNPNYDAGFPVDLFLRGYKPGGISVYTQAFDRLRGINGGYLTTSSTAAETGDNWAFDSQIGVYNTSAGSNSNPCAWLFRRAPGFFDVVCYTGTGSNTTITHNLGATPELMIVKRRGTANAWAVYANNDNTDYLVLNTNAATVDDNTYWNDTSPTSSVFSVGTNNAVNASGSTYVAYLFASVTGVSKVGSYTGNGSNQTINCGFTAGARFVMIKRTDSTGDWYVYDTARGIVSGNDPQLKLNSTAAEATGYDAIDPDNSGFIVNNDATNFPINVNNATYIYLSIA